MCIRDRHKPLLQQGKKVVWPTEGVTLRYSADSLEEVAEIFHRDNEAEQHDRQINCLGRADRPAERLSLIHISDYFAFSMILTRRQLTSLEILRVSMISTRSPMPASLFSS